MQISAHRGFWLEANEKNSATAFHRAFENNYGVETDVRDHKGDLVIAHDLPMGDLLSFKDFLKIYQQYDTTLELAINIKADGLQEKLKQILNEFAIKNYFVFDMSVPDALQYSRHNIIFYTRQSEYEIEPLSLYVSAHGVWVDCFEQDWQDYQFIKRHLAADKKVCLVSPELHKRDYKNCWQQLKHFNLHKEPNFSLCTDFPDQAKVFFYD